ncbi:MAG: FAD-dependent oxidoreductase [Candidatus Thorarchaeota archaeon]|nr:MAG: FAD-dependent oxidoreductase [Candidatus Thorarchaeota archaeon]
MAELGRIGVFVCHCGLNIAGTVDCPAVANYAGYLPGVAYSTDLLFACSDDGQVAIQRAITDHSLDGVVVASCTPRTHEPVFRKCVEEAGLNRYLYDQVNLREHVSWCHMNEPEKATRKAMALIAMSVQRVKQLEPLVRQRVNIIPKVAVIGGGVAGISASLDLANAGFNTYLIERRPTIGGQMALLDKVFPQSDCAICILGPIMSQVGQHPRINLMTYSEVDNVDGYVGNFRLKIRQKSRYIDTMKCTGCGECEDACPVEVPSEYEFGLANRTAIYRPFPQAVPNKYTIEKKGHATCRITCPAHVNIQGFVQLLHDGKFTEALNLYRDVSPFPGVLGRVCTSPCEDKCERGKYDAPVSIRNLHRFLADKEIEQGAEPVAILPLDKEDKVAIIGAGPAGIACAHDLIRSGYPVTIFEAKEAAGGLLRYGIPEFRLPRDIIDLEIKRVENLGVEFKMGKRIESLDELKEMGYKAVFIGTGAPFSIRLRIEGEDASGVFHALDFLDRVNSGKNVTIGDKVAIIGGGNAAIDAARTALRLGAKQVSIVYRRSRQEMPALAHEIDEAEREGVKILFLTQPISVKEEQGIVKGIKCIQMRLGDIDSSGRRRPVPVPDSEFTIKLDNIIIAIGQEVKPTGPLWELEHTEWGTLSVDSRTMQSSKPGVFAGGAVVLGGGGTVIEAVAHGKTAADSIARHLQGIDLLKARDDTLSPIPYVDVDIARLGQNMRPAMPTLGKSKRLRSFAEVELGLSEKAAVEEAGRCLSCGVCSECLQCLTVCEPNAIDHSLGDKISEIQVGAIVVTTGFKIYDPIETREYGFGTFDNVVTSAQFERFTNAAGPTKGKIKRPSDHEIPKSVAFIQCVGSRDRRVDADYCCYIGCENSLKQATQIKEKYPETEVTIYAMDIRTHGLGYESLYHRAREMGVIIVKGRPSEVEEIPGSKSLKVLAEDLYTGERLETTHELVVLATAILPHDDMKDFARKFKLSTGEYGYLLEAHPKLRPVDAFQDGVFLAGACLGPMDIPKAVAYGKAAAAGAQSLLTPGQFQIEPMFAEIDTELCMDCDLCGEICPYNAVVGERDERKVLSELCQGCGTCAGGCPMNAIDIHHYKREQIMPVIEAAAKVKGGVET